MKEVHFQQLNFAPSCCTLSALAQTTFCFLGALRLPRMLSKLIEFS
jgi:hypothetical protein